jgi:hypothetical protein
MKKAKLHKPGAFHGSGMRLLKSMKKSSPTGGSIKRKRKPLKK